ncbi:phosphatase 2C 57-like protein [Drosera capensis]
MALLNQQLHRFLATRTDSNSAYYAKTHQDHHQNKKRKNDLRVKGKGLRCSSTIAIDVATTSSGVAGIRWGSTKLQGMREEMEDDLVIVEAERTDGFSFAAVFDGHGGLSSVRFLRDELYKECFAALEGGMLLSAKDFNVVRRALQDAFQNVDARLADRLGMTEVEDESGSTATAMFIQNDMLVIAHVGDSSLVLARSGKAEVLTNPHRPYGTSTMSLLEVRRVRDAGGWVTNGRICGDIAVSRAFGDIRFKTKKKEMLEKGLAEGRWSQKFISRVQFRGDFVIARPEVYPVALGSDAEFILLASDGLWDYMSSSEAVSFVRKELSQHGDVQLACESLAKAALDQRSQDNISIVIADLGRTEWRGLPVERQNIFYELGQAFATVGIVSLGIWMSSLLSV